MKKTEEFLLTESLGFAFHRFMLDELNLYLDHLVSVDGEFVSLVCKAISLDPELDYGKIFGKFLELTLVKYIMANLKIVPESTELDFQTHEIVFRFEKADKKNTCQSCGEKHDN